LRGNVLSYYAKESHLKENKPRAQLFLTKEDTITEMQIKHFTDAPTEFLLTINIYNIGMKRKWEICLNGLEQQTFWYNAIRSFDGKAEISGFKMVQHPSSISKRREISSTDQFDGHLLSCDDISYDSENEDEYKENAHEPYNDHAYVASDIAQVEANVSIIPHWADVTLFVSLNTLAFVMRSGNIQSFWMSLSFVNFLLYFRLYHQTSSAKESPMSTENSQKNSIVVDEKGRTLQSNVLTSSMEHKVKRKLVPAGKTLPRAPLKKGSAIAKIVDEYGPNSIQAVRAYASASPDDYDETASHCFWNIRPTLIKLRVGPDYNKNRKKEPSAPALYDVHCIDVIYSETSLKHASDAFKMPEIPGITDIDTGHPYVPPMMILNIWLPANGPSILTKEIDGPTYCVIAYAVITEKTLEALKDFENASPAVKLFAKWCEKAETEYAYRSRFKLMGHLENIEKLGMPSSFSKFNGKPALVRKSGTFTRSSNYIQLSVNLRVWSFFARKGVHHYQPKMKDFMMNIGVTVESREEDELPEVLIGGARIMRMDLLKKAARDSPNGFIRTNF